MPTASLTQTSTYTLVDIKRVLASFASDFWMIGQATGLASRVEIDAMLVDLIGFAAGEYLEAIDVVVENSLGREVRAVTYLVSTDARGWANDRPGNTLWPRCPGGRLRILVSLNQTWWDLDESEQEAERRRLGIGGDWPTTTNGSSHAGMTATVDRRYASNAFGLKRIQYSQP